MMDFDNNEEGFRSRSNTWPRISVENDFNLCEKNNKNLAPVPEHEPTKKTLFGRRNICGLYSYADLITQAITTSPNQKLTLSQIYDWMIENVPIFKTKGENSASWKNSVRHNLSLHSKFVRLQNGGTGKGSWWAINPEAKQNKLGRRRSATMEPGKMEQKRSRAKKIANNMNNNPNNLVSTYSYPEQLQNLMPPFQQNPAFRQRTYSNSSCSRLSPIPSEEAVTTWVNSSPESMELYVPPSPYPAYQLSPAFRPRAHSSGSSSCGMSPRRAEDPYLLNNLSAGSENQPAYPYPLTPFRPRASSSGSSNGKLSPMTVGPSHGCEVLANTLQYNLNMQAQSSDGFSDKGCQELPPYNAQYQYNVSVSRIERPQKLDLMQHNMTDDINDIKVETMRTPLECNVEEVINQELNIEGTLDFN